jgi:hypothetical protein
MNSAGSQCTWHDTIFNMVWLYRSPIAMREGGILHKLFRSVFVAAVGGGEGETVPCWPDRLFTRHSWKNDYDIYVLLFQDHKSIVLYAVRYTKIVANIETLLRNRRYMYSCIKRRFFSLVKQMSFEWKISNYRGSPTYVRPPTHLWKYFNPISNTTHWHKKLSHFVKNQIIAYLPYFFPESRKTKGKGRENKCP